MSTRHIGHHHRKMVSYPSSRVQSLYTLVLMPLVALAITIVLLQRFAPLPAIEHSFSWAYLLVALMATFARLLVAYVLALVVSLPLALLVTWSPKAEKIFLPLFDIMQSVPVLAFFPVVIVFFVHYGFYSGAAIFILFITMLWSIVFSLVGGLRVIP